MKKILFTAVFLLMASNVFASPFLISDPNTGATFYKVKNVSSSGIENIICPALADGSLKTDVASVPVGTNTVTVSACASAPAWGEVCSADVNFTFTRPLPPAITSNIRLIQ